MARDTDSGTRAVHIGQHRVGARVWRLRAVGRIQPALYIGLGRAVKHNAHAGGIGAAAPPALSE